MNMTCLHCGKKLGFFSRFKDTPFCSEDHLRIHQEELERALIERLGSKTAPPSRSLHDFAEDSPAPLQSMMGLEAALRTGEQDRQAIQEYREPELPPKLPAPAPEPPKPKQVKAPAPLQEDYLLVMPEPMPALDTATPLIPPSSFAMITQSDVCTPSIGFDGPQCGFSPESAEFEVDTQSLLLQDPHSATELPTAFGEGDFGEDRIKLPSKLNMHVDTEDFSALSDPIPLDYTPAQPVFKHTPLGGREAIDARIRLRYPYAASDVTSVWNTLPSSETPFTVTDSTEWAPIEPATPKALNHTGLLEANDSIGPIVKVPLSIQTLVRYDLDGADTEEFGNTLSVMARTLASDQSLATDCSAHHWNSRLALPAGSARRDFKPSWNVQRGSDRIAPVTFPSLFQLSPMLPPRPESMQG